MIKCILPALFVASFFSAQERTIDTVQIQGKFWNTPYKKVNENILVISKKEIENSPANSIDELLQQYIGLDIKRRGSNGVQSDISIRGGSFEQVLVLVNGIRMNDSQTGHNTLNLPVDLQNVERIEVIKGPAARRFGNNAYSGAINIITKSSSEEKVKISAQGGDFSTYDFGLNATFGSEKFSNLFSVNSGASEGYRHNTDYKINTIFYQNQYQIKDGSIRLQAGFSEKKFGANGFYASPLATEQYEEVQASVVSIAHQQKFGNFNLNSNIYWRRGQDMYLYNRVKPEIYRNMHIGNNVGGEINGSYQSSLGTTGLGLELRKEFLSSNNLGDRERFVTQLFFEHHFSLLQDRLQIVPGITWVNFSNAGDFFYPGVDVGFDINDHNKIYGNIAKVNRVATYTDLYYVSRTEEGNPNLVPESALSYELGYRFLKSSTQIKAAVFGRETKDGIDWTKATAADKWKAYNIGSLTTRGFEAEISQGLRGFLKSYSVGYAFTEVTQNSTDKMLRYVADNLKHQFTAKMENRITPKLINQLVYRFQERPDKYSYHLLDEKLSYRMKAMDVYVLVNNITNTSYTEIFGVPMPKRWFHVGFSYNIGF